ncbi:citrate synthase [Sulfurimonas sp. RIFOXYB12_FULL_35_9]|uniref:citrate synthase n=2 Tax=unclassified Sulfurimonas TaxID=2623549 RepID=UPI0008CB6E83|nr:citrate synthase [Sulfurimonas sp. RIFOXYB12_FULL_35_9]MBS4068773.1 citrate synthase [Sulfurimonas sp.]MDO8261136.1 citrate synthase [Candidatus Magasanikbacteria bacterium]OHE03273.1 MAG: citrate (Si)-synthase [Sulfurimonas sp. RIFOXYB12_FULL_35_9]
MSRDTVTLTNNRDGKSYEFPILDATVGPSVIDISTLYKETKMFTYDEGYTSTASCKSDITYIDGDAGKLMYRGYDIAYLANQKSFLDTAYLLLNGELPTKEELENFTLEMKKRSFVHEGIKKLFDSFPDGAHPMAILSAGVSALSTFYYKHLEIKNSQEYTEMANRIVAKIPTLAAFSYRYSNGLPIIYPDMNKGFTENFLYMLRAYPHSYIELKPIEIKALDTIFTLHADHEQNASTTAVRNLASTNAHPYAAISAGIGALWGKSHGGANESVIRQLEMIGTVDRVDEFIAKAKDKDDPFKLMGFGHRVYKNFDPRATILKNLRNDLMEELGISSELIEVANKIEKIALNDEYFISRSLYPNIDFYSGLILQALKIPKEMFAVIFVIGRSPGWIAQWSELSQQKSIKIARPRQLYTGPKERTPEY